MRCASFADEALPGQQFCARHGVARVAAATSAPTEVYASFWKRVGAFILDFLIVWTLAVIVAFAVVFLIPEPYSLIVIALVVVLYYPALECSPLQGTLGKAAVAIKVTRRDGERIGIGRALVRYIGRWISTVILCIGFLLPLFTARREALHDKIAGTLVVEKSADAARIAEAGPAAPTSGGAIAVALGVLGFLGLITVGMLAAIAIPAYQDFTVRSQVASAIDTAQEYEFAVMQRYRQTGTFEGISEDVLFVMPPRDPYVQSFEVEDGAVVMTLGGEAHKHLHGAVIAWGPAVDGNGISTWICGRQTPPEDVTLVSLHPAEHTSIPDKYLPKKCRADGSSAE